jgi:acyl-CoA thioesterase-1
MALIASSAGAQQQGPPSFITRECQAPSATATESPLPNVAAALQRRQRIRILAIGASASGGAGASKGGYHATIRQLLQRLVKGLRVQIVHRGVSGELAQNASYRLKVEVGLNAPDLVLWQVGTNDALSYVPVERVEDVVTGTIRWLKEHRVDVVLVGLQYVSEMARDSHYQAIRLMLRRVAQQENVIIVRRYEAMETIRKAQTADQGATFDEFAYTEAAYNCMAQYVARAISVALFGKNLRPPQSTPPPQE